MSTSTKMASTLWRTLSGASRKTGDAALRPTASMTEISTEAHTDQRQGFNQGAPASPAAPYPSNAALFSAGSLTESLASGSPTNSASSCLLDAGDVGSPRGVVVDSPPPASHQPQHQPQQQQYRKYTIHGMEPYDYWNLIRSL